MNPIIQFLMKCDDAYFNKQEILPNDQYDLLYKAAKIKWPKDEYFKTVGATPIGKTVKLSAPKPSMEQKRPNEAVKYMATTKKPFVITAKIDGIAGQLTYKRGKLILATTRGNGVEGTDITEHAKHIIGVWPTLSAKYKDQVIIIDGEFTMHRSTFASLNLDKYVNTLSLCRSMIVNKKVPDPKILSRMVFIAYGWHEQGKVVPAKTTQLSTLESEMFVGVNNCAPINENNMHWIHDNMKMRFIPRKFEPFTNYFHEKPVTKEWILATLAHLRKSFDLDLDGLVMTLNEPQKKAIIYNYKIKPDTEDQEHKRATIKHIELNMSARGLMKPVAVFQKPVEFNGTQVKRCTLHNWDTVKSMKLGAGSVIEIIRSGTVIPKIQRCIKPMGYEQPKRCIFCKNKLVFNGTDLLCDNAACIGPQLPLMQNFFAKLKVDALGPGTIEAFAKAGYNSVPKILSMSPKTMAKLDRMGEKSAAKIISNLKTMVSKWRINEFMAASGIFSNESTSLGETLLQLICEKYTLAEFKSGKIKPYQLTALPKIGLERAELFVASLPDFIAFYEAVNAVVKIKFVEAGTALGGRTFVFTNFRDSTLEETIKTNGGKVGSSVTGATSVLFYADTSSVKYRKAFELKKQGLPVMLVKSTEAAEFIKNELQPF